MGFATGGILGLFLGFTFGVGCALAVMYSIYQGGYRAAVRDFLLPSRPERLQTALARQAPPPAPHAGSD